MAPARGVTVIFLRELDIQDSDPLQRLRLDSVKSDPLSFCTSLEEVRHQPAGDFRALINRFNRRDDCYLLGGFSDGQDLLGSLELERLSGTFRAHKARLSGLMVSRQQRRRGIARRLCEEAILRSRTMKGVEKLVLEVTSEALPALHLYRSLGFRIESVEPMALKQKGRYLDEIRMALYL